MFIIWCMCFLCFCAMLVQANVLKNNIKNLKIVYTSDIHSKFDPGENLVLNCNHGNAIKKLCYNNFGRMVHLINEERQDANTLVLHTGDTVQNDIFFTPAKQYFTSDLINLLKFDAKALGIGDFDYGTENLADYLNFLDDQRLAANVKMANTPELTETIEKFTSFTVNDLNIGIIGYVAANMIKTSNLSEVKLVDEVQAVREVVKHLKNKNIDFIIALGQTSMENAVKISKIKDVDLVISHSNYQINGDFNPPSILPGNTFDLLSPDDEHPAYLMQTFGFVEYIGVLEVDIDVLTRKINIKNRFKFIESDTPVDQNVLNVLVDWGKQKFNKQTCETPMMQEKCLYQECPLGLAITDAILDADLGDFNAVIYNAKGFTSSSNCISNPESPTVSMEDILTSFNSDKLVKVTLTGEKLSILLEKNACDDFNDFLHVAGLNLRYNLTAPCGSRLKKEKNFFWLQSVNRQLEIFLPSTAAHHQPENATIDITATYSVIFPKQFFATEFGKEYIEMINQADFKHLPVSVHDVIEDYFAIHQISEITPVGGRITSFYRSEDDDLLFEKKKPATFETWTDPNMEIPVKPKRNKNKKPYDRSNSLVSTTILPSTTVSTATNRPTFNSATETTVTNDIVPIPETTINVIFNTTKHKVTTEATITTTHRNDTDGYTSVPLVETTTHKTGKSAKSFSFTWCIFVLISSYISRYMAVKFLLFV